MDEFRTRGGRCVIEHGELRIERIGFGDRFERYVKNSKRSWRERYGKSRFRFALTVVGFVVSVAGWRVGRRFVRRAVRGFSTDRKIPPREVVSVEPKQGGWFSDPVFVIRYEEYGEGKKRFVSVLSLSPIADDEFEEAKALLFDQYDVPLAEDEW